MAPGHERVDAALARFRDAVRRDVRLDDAWLAMSGALLPTLDDDRWRAELDALAAACPDATRDGVVRHLFGDGRLRGERDRYGDWRNSRIDHVLGEGVGIPIALSAVAIEVGRRVGVPLVGVGMPAHFILGSADDRDWFSDPFNGGEVLDRDGCKDLFRRVTGGSAGWRDDYLRPAAPRAIVVRMLNNLRAAFVRDGERLRLGLVLRMRSSVLVGEPTYEARRSQAVFN